MFWPTRGPPDASNLVHVRLRALALSCRYLSRNTARCPLVLPRVRCQSCVSDVCAGLKACNVWTAARCAPALSSVFWVCMHARQLAACFGMPPASLLAAPAKIEDRAVHTRNTRPLKEHGIMPLTAQTALCRALQAALRGHHEAAYGAEFSGCRAGPAQLVAGLWSVNVSGTACTAEATKASQKRCALAD